MISRQRLLLRVRALAWFFIVGLVLSGVTALPLVSEVDWLVQFTGADRFAQRQSGTSAPAWAEWLLQVRAALRTVDQSFPFLAYGTDWLAFGHFIIALAFVGLLRDPVRNRWLIDFGLSACGLVIPYALICGAVRGIPIWWRLIDCSFGVFGAIPLWLCRRTVGELEMLSTKEAAIEE